MKWMKSQTLLKSLCWTVVHPSRLTFSSQSSEVSSTERRFSFCSASQKLLSVVSRFSIGWYLGGMYSSTSMVSSALQWNDELIRVTTRKLRAWSLPIHRFFCEQSFYWFAVGRFLAPIPWFRITVVHLNRSQLSALRAKFGQITIAMGQKHTIIPIHSHYSCLKQDSPHFRPWAWSPFSRKVARV